MRAIAGSILLLLVFTSSSLAEPANGWQLEERPSRLSPELTDYLLWSNSLHDTRGPLGVRVRPIMALECRQGDMAVWFDFGRFAGGGVVRISYRIGRGKVQLGDVTVSADRRTFGVWDRDRAISFINALHGEEQLRLEVAIPGSKPLLGIFDLKGLDDTVAPLQKACNW